MIKVTISHAVSREDHEVYYAQNIHLQFADRIKKESICDPVRKYIQITRILDNISKLIFTASSLIQKMETEKILLRQAGIKFLF